jgi:hypothetical protein
MSDAEFIDDRGEAGPEDNAEWLRWAAETYASAVEKGGCYAPEPDWDVDAISPGLRGAAAEIERLRARIKVLEELLRPLADAAAQYDPARDRDDHLEWFTRLTKGHLRKARAALKEAQP